MMLAPAKPILLLMMQSGCQSFTRHGTHSSKVFGVHSRVHQKTLVCRLSQRMYEEEKFPPKAFETGFELSNAVSKYYFHPSETMEIEKTYGCPIGKWDVSRVQDFSELFYFLHSFNEDIQSWDVSSATDMSKMFCRLKSFNQDLSSWNTSQVKDMSSMFKDAKLFNQDLSSWDTSH
eukprot:scaffold65460_cov49-Attheya_sp.AAC.1